MNMTAKKMVRAAMIAVVYTVISLVFAPLAYGAIQVRFSEALTLLPIFTPDAILGVTLGCFLTNMIGSSPIDMVFGTLATLLAALCTYKARNLRIKGLPLAAAVPPILINAVIVGAEITYFFMPEQASLSLLLFNMATVGLGQIISCGVIGVALTKVIEKVPALRACFTDEK
ncbi:MAG: QueT transporter family protein [Oscillospiraceae bacterium]|nr:QueT transporter family protein [Oscillospiraceae bacterium]